MADPEKHTIHRTQCYYKSQKMVLVLNEQILILFVIHVVIFGIIFIHFECVSLLRFI